MIEALQKAGEQVVSAANRVRETVTEAVGEVSRGLTGANAAPTAAEADVALHHVAARVAPDGGGAAAPANSLTADEQAQIEQGVEGVFQAAGTSYPDAAVELADQLRGRSEEYRAEFMSELNEFNPGLASDVFRAASGGERNHMTNPFVSEEDQRLIGQSLGAAYDRGLLPPDFVDNLLEQDARYNMPPNNEYTGSLVAQSGSQNLINDYVDRSMEMAQGDDPEWVQSFNLGAARAMAGDPQIMQERLAQMSEDGTLDSFLSKIDPEWHRNRIAGYDSGADNALATFVKGAADVEPPTPGVRDLFTSVANNYMDRAGVPEAMTDLFTAGYNEDVRYPNGKVAETVFHSNAQYLMDELTRLGGDSPGDDSLNVSALSKFFQHSIFNSEIPEWQRESVKGQVQQFSQNALSDIEYGQDEKSRANSATQLGVALGSVMEGYEGAVQANQDKEAAAKEAVDLMFDLVPAGDAIKGVLGRVGLGALSGQAENVIKDKLAEVLADTDDPGKRNEIFQAFIGGTNEQLEHYYAQMVLDGVGNADTLVTNAGE